MSPSGELMRRVWAIYFTWYRRPDGPAARWEHWSEQQRFVSRNGRHEIFRRTCDPEKFFHHGRRDLASSHYPLIGPYDSADERIIRYHLELMRLSGIDGVLLDWWGTQIEGTPTESVVRIAPEYGIKTGFLLDGAPRMSTDLEAYARRVNILYEAFGENENCLLEDGRMPVLLWYFYPGFTYETCRRMTEGWKSDGLKLLTIADIPVDPAEEPARWAALYDATGHYGGRDDSGVHSRAYWSREGGAAYMAVAQPGGDAKGVQRILDHPYANIARHSGMHYMHRWKMAGELRADGVIITSWNEWHEGTEIEPSREYGLFYVKMTRYLAQLYREGRMADYDDAELDRILTIPMSVADGLI